MVTSRSLLLALLLVASGCAGARAPAGTVANPPVLVGADGKGATLAQLAAERDATVLVFWSAVCPCVRRYQERIDALLDAFPRDRVAVLAVSSNAGETLADGLRVARERSIRVPIVRDEAGIIARALGARTTPTVVVLDRTGAKRFIGWIDNERRPGEQGREPWLERAVRGVLDGTPFGTKTPVYGCPITRPLVLPACCRAP